MKENVMLIVCAIIIPILIAVFFIQNIQKKSYYVRVGQTWNIDEMSEITKDGQVLPVPSKYYFAYKVDDSEKTTDISEAEFEVICNVMKRVQ